MDHVSRRCVNLLYLCIREYIFVDKGMKPRWIRILTKQPATRGWEPSQHMGQTQMAHSYISIIYKSYDPQPLCDDPAVRYPCLPFHFQFRPFIHSTFFPPRPKTRCENRDSGVMLLQYFCGCAALDLGQSLKQGRPSSCNLLFVFCGFPERFVSKHFSRASRS